MLNDTAGLPTGVPTTIITLGQPAKHRASGCTVSGIHYSFCLKAPFDGAIANFIGYVDFRNRPVPAIQWCLDEKS